MKLNWGQRNYRRHRHQFSETGQRAEAAPLALEPPPTEDPLIGSPAGLC